MSTRPKMRLRGRRNRHARRSPSRPQTPRPVLRCPSLTVCPRSEACCGARHQTVSRRSSDDRRAWADGTCPCLRSAHAVGAPFHRTKSVRSRTNPDASSGRVRKIRSISCGCPCGFRGGMGVAPQPASAKPPGEERQGALCRSRGGVERKTTPTKRIREEEVNGSHPQQE